MRQYPKPMPAVIDPHKHIMENHMPIDPSQLEGVHHHVKAEINDDGKVDIWVKDRRHTMEPSEAISFARQVLEKAASADTEAQRRQQVKDGLDE